MNAKRAKRLRREAEAATEGKPQVGYVTGRATVVEQRRPDGEVKRVKHTTFQVHPETTRGVYRKLKAAA
jgi:hypothetical protein